MQHIKLNMRTTSTCNSSHKRCNNGDQTCNAGVKHKIRGIIFIFWLYLRHATIHVKHVTSEEKHVIYEVKHENHVNMQQVM